MPGRAEKSTAGLSSSWGPRASDTPLCASVVRCRFGFLLDSGGGSFSCSGIIIYCVSAS